MTADASPPGSLAGRLRRSNHHTLLSLVEAHGRELQLRDVRQILLNPFCDRRIIEELLSIRSLMTIYEVRVAVCRHRHTPQADAMRYVADLFWRDLVEITVDRRLKPGLRQVASRTLRQRLPRLTVGELIALARRSTPPVTGELIRHADARVRQAVYENPRLTAQDLLPLASDPKATPRQLESLANHPRWGRPYEIRAALGRNPQAPFRVLFALLPDLLREDLEEIAALKGHSSIVRQRAHELLAERSVRPRGQRGKSAAMSSAATTGSDGQALRGPDGFEFDQPPGDQ